MDGYTTIYSLPSDIMKYHIFPHLSFVERLFFRISVYCYPFPDTITSEEAKQICSNVYRLVKPFLRCYVILDEEYIPCLSRKWLTITVNQTTTLFDKHYELRKEPRLENIIVMFAAYNDNNGLKSRFRYNSSRKQAHFGYVERHKNMPAYEHSSFNMKLTDLWRRYGPEIYKIVIKERDPLDLLKIIYPCSDRVVSFIRWDYLYKYHDETIIKAYANRFSNQWFMS